MRTAGINKFCAGCGACSTLCPKNAIKMITNELGFYVPEINSDLCIKCGKCVKNCPSLRKTVPHDIVLYAARTKIDTERIEASSGGLFGEFAKKTLHNNGVVYGAVFDIDFHVIIERAENVKSIAAMHGAKYIQSKAWEAYTRVKCDLENGRTVLFTGTPCQITGLKAYLGIKYNRLLCVEVACHGVPSDGMFQRYLESLDRITGNNKENLSYFTFRDKKDKQISWKNYYVHAEYNNGMVYHVPFFKDRYMQSYFSDLAINPACYTCKNKIHESSADITIADFWGIESYKPELNDDKGLSLVVIHTNKGRKAFESVASNIVANIVEEEPALAKNTYISIPAQQNCKKKEFEDRYICGEDYIEVVDRILKKPLLKRVISKIEKSFLGKK